MKPAIVAFLGTTETILGDATKALGKAGTPVHASGSGGREGAERRLLEGPLGDRGPQARRDQAADGNPVKSAASFKALTTKVNHALNGLNSTFNNVSKHDPKDKLKKAFAATKACQSSGS